MDLYKKKNLKFDKNLGLGRNLRAVERSAARAESRHTRFSLLRCLEDDDSEQNSKQAEKNEEAISRIPTFGKPNIKAPMSRAEMLQKWKEEKRMKRDLELKSKKPTFKAGIVAPKPVSVLPSFAKTTIRTPSKTDSRLKISVDAKTRFDDKFKSIKEASVQSSFGCKSQASSNMKLLNNKESCIQSSNNKKFPATGSSNLKTKQESHIQLPNSSNKTSKKTSCISTKQIKNTETQTQMPIKSQIITKKTSHATTSKEVNSKLPSSSVVPPKLTVSKSLKPPQALSNGIPRKNQIKIPEPTTSQMEFHSQLTNKSKPSFITSRQTKTEQNSCGIGKGFEKTATQIKQKGIPLKNGTVPKPQNKSVSKIGFPAKKKEDTSNITFRCEISHIEPSEEKPIAPKGFLFQPPTDLSFSFLEDGGISSIFSKLRAGTERTSTPKRADLREIEEETKGKCSSVRRESLNEVFSPPVQNTVNESCHEVSETETKEKVHVPIDTTSDLGEEKKTSLTDKESPKNSPNRSGINKLHTAEKTCNVAESIFENKLEIENQDPVQKALEVSLPDFEESPLLKDLTTPELPVQQKIDLHEKQGPANLLKDSLPVFEENPVPKEQTTSESSQQPKSDLLDDKVSIISPIEFPEGKKPVDLKDLPKQEFNFEKPKMQDLSMSLPEANSATFKERDPLVTIEIPSNTTKLQEKDLLPENEASIITRSKPFTRSSEIKTRSFRRSEKPPLESINESLENCSLLESPPKPSKKGPLKKSTLCKDFTPRRSLRLAKLSEFDSPENLFDVRPSLCATPTDSKDGACNSSNLTYDFDKLHLETLSNEEPPVAQRRQSTRKGKVSLLYTPPPKGRVSTVRKSIKGDLMSFSPDV